jgi:hypothetical protein
MMIKINKSYDTKHEIHSNSLWLIPHWPLSPYRASYSPSSNGDCLFLKHFIIATAEILHKITSTSYRQYSHDYCDNRQRTQPAFVLTFSVLYFLVVWTETYFLFFVVDERFLT